MPHTKGYRAHTRDMFSQPFRCNGVTKLSTYLTTYQVGDYVDIKANASQQKGMPYKHYHGRTGIIFNVTKRAVGLRVNKLVNGKIMSKMLHIRVEHVRPSKCRDELIRRVKENEAIKASKPAEKVNLKRQAVQPRESYVYVPQAEGAEMICPIAFSDLL